MEVKLQIEFVMTGGIWSAFLDARGNSLTKSAWLWEHGTDNPPQSLREMPKPVRAAFELFLEDEATALIQGL